VPKELNNSGNMFDFMNNIISVFLISLMAGLGTALGGLIVIIRKPGKKSFGFLMGFTAGVMITLSFHQLVNEAWHMSGYITTTISFALGAIFMLLIDLLIPHIRFSEKETSIFDLKLFRTGILVAIGISIHNLPEGIAVGASYMYLPKFGLFIAMAIALHNIPEGIATALPLCKSGLCRLKSFKITLYSGLVEPIGALFAAVFLTAFKELIPASLAFAGGVMVFITLDELIPTARKHGHQHFTALGIILGAIFVFLLAGIFGV
jgi:zinc transporter, ZIP family